MTDEPGVRVAGQRMSRAERHAQLLDAAVAIVRDEGADALTLARVAEAAGVSKPIAYQHFETRTGLLRALYRRLDDEQVAVARTSLRATAGTPGDTAGVLAAAYVDCVLHLGREYGAVTAALAAGAESESDEVLRTGRGRYVRLYREALERFGPLPSGVDTALLGVVGAAETLSREVTAGRLDRDAAVDAITRLLLGVLGRD